MDTNLKDKFNSNDNDNKEAIKEVLGDLERSLKEVKRRISIGDEGPFEEKMRQFKDKSEKVRESAKDLKKKYDEIDPQKQKAIIATLSALLAILLTAISFGMACQKKNDK